MILKVKSYRILPLVLTVKLPQTLTNEKSTSVQLMAWCLNQTEPCHNQNNLICMGQQIRKCLAPFVVIYLFSFPKLIVVLHLLHVFKMLNCQIHCDIACIFFFQILKFYFVKTSACVCIVYFEKIKMRPIGFLVLNLQYAKNKWQRFLFHFHQNKPCIFLSKQ